MADRQYRLTHPDRYAEDIARIKAKRAVAKLAREERAEACCSRKTDLTRAKGRIIVQCRKCRAMLDAGPEPTPFDHFTPIL